MAWIQTQQKYLDPDPFEMFGSPTEFLIGTAVLCSLQYRSTEALATAGGYEDADLWRSPAGGKVQTILSRPVWILVLILDGTSLHVAHTWWKIGLFGWTYPVCDCSQTNQTPYTGRIIEIAPYVRTYLWVTILYKYHGMNTFSF